MPRFAYTAKDRNGQAVADELDAGSRKEALRRLQARGLKPLKLSEQVGRAKPTDKKSPNHQPWAANQQAPPLRLKHERQNQIHRAHRLPFCRRSV